MTAFKRVEQMIFDKVCAHLAQQKKRSIFGSQCAYRGENGMKCAVGALLPDDMCREEMEGTGAVLLCRQIGWLIPYAGLLDELQDVHDFAGHCIKAQLKDLAYSYRLNPNAITLITEWEGESV